MNEIRRKLTSEMRRYSVTPQNVPGSTTGSVVGNITDNAALIFNHSDVITFAGVVSGSGSLNQAGAGTLTLTGTGGTLALHLVGQAQGGFAPLPMRFPFTVGEGTGSFQNATGQGRAMPKLAFAPVAFGSQPAGNFTLKLQGAGRR